jgi:2-desacetyl-2-hydroxyethyl bacteriochlorophyllide A dehydrogenase
MTIAPDEMYAVRIRGFGGPDAMQPETVAVPKPGPDEALVRVAFCGVCRHDLLTRAGAFPSIDLPVTLGHQVSGHVVETGPNSPVAVGQRVLSMIYTGCGSCPSCVGGNEARCVDGRPQFLGEDFDGGYAEYVVVKARTLVPVPDAVSLEQAAILTCTLGTAHHALRSRGHVQHGDTVLITGASGGVGLHAVQLAHLFGAHVTAVVSDVAREESVRAAGADDVIIADDRKFARELRRRKARGVDVVLDVVGSATLLDSIHSVRDGGTVVVIGNVDGQRVTIPPAYLILKEATLTGTKSCTASDMAEVLSHIEGGDVTAEVNEIAPLASAVDVHTRMERGEIAGRIVLAAS